MRIKLLAAFVGILTILTSVPRLACAEESISDQLASATQTLVSGDRARYDGAIAQLREVRWRGTPAEKKQAAEAVLAALEKVTSIKALRDLINLAGSLTTEIDDDKLKDRLRKRLLTFGDHRDLSVRRQLFSVQHAFFDVAPRAPDLVEQGKKKREELLRKLEVAIDGPQPTEPTDKEKYLKVVLAVPDPLVGHGRAMKMQVIRDAKIGNPEVWRAITAGLEDSDDSVRMFAVDAVQSIPGAPEVLVAAAIQLMSDASPQVRAAAIRICRSSSRSDCAEVALKNLVDADESVLNMLASLKEPRVISALTGLLSDRDGAVRERAARSLGRFGPDALSARDALLKSCEGDYREVCDTAYAAVFAIDPSFTEPTPGQPQKKFVHHSTEKLREIPECLAALEDGDAHSRFFAMQCLRSTPRSSSREMNKVSAEDKDKLFEAAKRGLKDPYAQVRQESVVVLENLVRSGFKISKLLIAQCAQQALIESRDFKIHFMQMLNGISSDDYPIQALLQLLKDPQPDVRQWAAQALRPFVSSDKEVREAVLLAVNDRVPDVATAAINSFRWGGASPEALEALRSTMLNRADVQVRAIAASTLLRANPQNAEAATYLTTLLRVNDYEVRQEAILAIKNSSASSPDLQSAIDEAISPPYEGLSDLVKPYVPRTAPTSLPEKAVNVTTPGAAASATPEAPKANVSLNLQLSNSGAMVYLYFSGKGAKKIWYRLDGEGKFESTGSLTTMDPESGTPLAAPMFFLPEDIDEDRSHIVSVKWVDTQGNNFGPVDLTLDLKKEVVKFSKSIIEVLDPKWLHFRLFQGRRLVYFTALVSHKNALKRIAYSYNEPTLDKALRITRPDSMFEWGGIGPDDQDYFELPKSVSTVFVQLTYIDGSQSKIRSFDATKWSEH